MIRHLLLTSALMAFAVPAAAETQIMVERTATGVPRSEPVKLLGFGDDHAFFFLRIRLKKTTHGLKTDFQRAYQSRCATWSVGSNGAITARSELLESYQYPALDDERKPWTQVFVPTKASDNSRWSLLREGGRTYAPLPSLRISPEELRASWFECANMREDARPKGAAAAL